MFEVGDKIIYPMYGAGVIEGIEEKERDHQPEKYYIIHIPNGNMRISLMAKKSEPVGLRSVLCQQDILAVLQEMETYVPVSSDNWNQRYKENLEKIKTGKLDMVTQVVKCLTEREKLRSLSSVEKKMLNTAKQIALSEIVYSCEIDIKKAEELLANSVSNC